MNPRSPAIIFDLDGTLTTIASPWRRIHETVGVWDGQAEHYLERWLAGRLSYDDFCRHDVTLWRDQRLEVLEAVLDGIEFNRNTRAVIDEVNAAGLPSLILSSGFTRVAERLIREHRWESVTVWANRLEPGPEVEIRVSADPDSPISKSAHARRELERLGACTTKTLVVSDSQRDLDQLNFCGHHLLIHRENDLLGVIDWIRSNNVGEAGA